MIEDIKLSPKGNVINKNEFNNIIEDIKLSTKDNEINNKKLKKI